MNRAFRAYLGLGILCGFVFFWRLGANGLFDLDEGLYAESAREMALTGDLVIPRVNGTPFFEKPPLIYWTAAGSIRILGRSEFAVRIWPALATSLLVFLLAIFGTRLFGRRAGFFSALIFTLSPLVFGAARQLTTDATLDLFTAGALFCFYLARTSNRKAFHIAFWAFCALGVLTKGAPGILIPCLVAGGFILWEWRAGTSSSSTSSSIPFAVVGILVFLLIAIPWHVAAVRNGGQPFVQEYIVRQHLHRFQGGDTAHMAPFWFFVPVLLMGFYPWSLFLPAAARAVLRPVDNAGDSKAGRFLLLWSTLVFLMFSTSGSKLVSYILPMFAPASLLVGSWLDRALDRMDTRRVFLGCGVIGSILSCGVFGVAAFSKPILECAERRSGRPIDVPPAMLTLGTHLLASAAAGSLAYLILLLLKKQRVAFAAIACGMALFLVIAIFEGLPTVDSLFLRAPHSLAEEAGQQVTDTTYLWICLESRRPSILFYLPDSLIEQKRVTESKDHPPLPARETLVITRDSRGLVSPSVGTIVLKEIGPWHLYRIPAQPLLAAPK